MPMIEKAGLQIATELADFIETQALPGTGIDPHVFWAGTARIFAAFTPAAKAQLGTWDTKFDDDYAVWFAAVPPPAPVVESGY